MLQSVLSIEDLYNLERKTPSPVWEEMWTRKTRTGRTGLMLKFSPPLLRCVLRREAHSKMQIEGCPSTKDQSRLSVLQRFRDYTAMQFPQITRPQHSKRRSCSVGFSVFSSYCGEMTDRRVAQVQHAWSIIVTGSVEKIRSKEVQ